MPKSYAIVGSWGFEAGPKGVSTYAYHAHSGELSYIDTVMEKVCATQVCLDEERQIIYFVDTRESQEDQIGGGGYVWAFQINMEDGKLSLLNRRETMCSLPEYLCLDKTRKYLLTAHHASQHQVTRIVKDETGGYRSLVDYDDAALVLFRLETDGSIGEICDVSIPAANIGLKGEPSHLHYVMHNPRGTLFIVCDKGLDRIYTYRLDEESGRLIFLQETIDERGSLPRYAVFHPNLPLVYINHEHNVKLDTYQYDEKTGKMTKLATTSLLFDWQVDYHSFSIEASDLVSHPDGTHVYAAVRGADIVAVLEMDSFGGLVLKQNIDCGGKTPRGLCVSPDGRYLFTLNGDSQTIATFVIEKDGRLCSIFRYVHANRSACMKILAAAV